MKSLINKIVTYSLTSSVLLLSPTIATAIPVEKVVNPQQHNDTWVTDMADILSDTTEVKLNQIIEELEQSNGTEIAIVTVDDTTPANTPKAYATELFNYWGIGKADENNGVLFLISIDDRRVEIETGLGIEPILSNAEVKKIIDRKITPQFKQQNFDRGTLEGTQALIDALDNSNSNNIPFGWIAVLIGASASILGMIKLRRRSKRIYINPEETNYRLNRNDSRDIYCAKCSQPMTRVENIELNKAQKVARKIGSVSYRGYQCSNCSQATNSILNIAYMSTSYRYNNCPECRELTLIRTQETTEKATKKKKGKLLVKNECQCCDYTKETISDIPRLRENHYHSRSSTSSSSSYSGYYGGGSSGGGSSSSGGFGGGSSGGGSSSSGGFGGGSSDGGGAGGSW